MLEERRGHYFRYMTDKIFISLNERGFKRHIFRGNDDEIMSEEVAKEVKDKYKSEGRKAMILCNANKLRIKMFQVWYK